MSSGAVGEHVAAADTPLRAHQSGALHRQQDLLQIGLRQRRALGDLLHRGGPFAAAECEREEGAGRVIAARRDFHLAMLASEQSAHVAVLDRRSRAWSPMVRLARKPLRSTCGSRAARARRSVGRRARPGAVRPGRRRVDSRAGAVRRRGRAAGARRSRLERGAGSRGACCPRLSQMEGGAITTVAPSTTATALTSIATGLAPAQHGIVGYRMLVDTDVLNVLRWTVRGPRPPARSVRRAAARAVPRPRGPGRHAHRVPRHRVHPGAPARRTARGLAHGGRTRRAVRARGRGGREVRVRVLPGCRHDRARVRPARPRVRARARVRRLLRGRADRRAARRTPRCSSRRITARCTSKPESWIEIPELIPLASAMAGDGRFRYLYANPNTRKELLGRARELVSDRAWVWSRAEMLEMGLFGDGRDRNRARADRQRRARGARAGCVRRSRAAQRAHAASRGTAASRPTRCTCRSSPRAARADARYSARSTSISSVTPAGCASQRSACPRSGTRARSGRGTATGSAPRRTRRARAGRDRRGRARRRSSSSSSGMSLSYSFVRASMRRASAHSTSGICSGSRPYAAACSRAGPAPPVDRHLDVRGEHRDEHARPPRARPAGGVDGRATATAHASSATPLTYVQARGGGGQRVGDDLVEELGLHEVRDAGGTEERGEAEGGRVGTGHGSCCQIAEHALALLLSASQVRGVTSNDRDVILHRFIPRRCGQVAGQWIRSVAAVDKRARSRGPADGPVEGGVS